MAVFKYVGRNSQGNQVKGILDAVNAEGVAEQLTRQRVIPVSITQANDKKVSSNDLSQIDLSSLFGFAAISLDDLIIFCRQMYALVRAGVPILKAINGMAETSNSVKLKVALLDIANQLEGGFQLSSALNKHPKLFSPLFISLVNVGENTGKLDDAFLKLASYFHREQDTRKRIKSALRYPSFVLIAISAAIVILNIFVIPTFANMFSKLGADLPWATQALIISSNFFLNYWEYLLVGLVVTFFSIRYYIKTTAGRYFWDKRKIKLPIIGSIIERSILSRFSHSFAIVLRAGVPMTSGLTLVSEAADNTFMRDKILTMRTNIASGESLLRSSVASGLFTPLVLQMIAVGEETGQVDSLLEEVGNYYEREVDYDLTTLTAKIEPILIAVVAVMVLILALGIFTPMWDMMSAFKN